MRVLGDLHVPIAFGLKSGHVSSQNFTLPFGVRAKLKVDEPSTLEYEPAVRDGRDISGRCARHDKEAYPSDWHLRYRHGVAGGNA